LNRSRPRSAGEPGDRQTGRIHLLRRGDLFITIKNLVLKNRSYRRFYQAVPDSIDTLRELVDLARLSASGANRQPLKYILSCDTAMNARVFATLAWAGYLPDWPGPEEGERPAAHIILGDKTITQSFGCDQREPMKWPIGARSRCWGSSSTGRNERLDRHVSVLITCDTEGASLIGLFHVAVHPIRSSALCGDAP